MKKPTFYLACVLLCVITSTTLAQSSKRDQVVSIKTIQGRTVGFEMGDYQHVSIKPNSGRLKSFFIFKPGLDYFLALNKDKPLTLTYEVAEMNLPESGGKTRIERLTSARVGKLTYQNWWKQVSRGNTLEQLEEKYGTLVKKYPLK